MTALRTALTHLASLSVAGVSHNYGIDQIPPTLNRAQLPALLVLPIDVRDVRLFKERGEGFQTVAFSGGARTMTYTVTHLLLVSAASATHGLQRQLPALIDLIDAYFTALKADVTLGGTLLEPAHVTVEPGTFAHGETKYYGCALRHLWKLEV
ncbi:MAG: hypothetical protein HXY40_08120 [Chloroflexi bacterium]|nr:hypothetical protein [Chloroflexota bacterium]